MTESDKSAIIEMALSDHVPFDTIKAEYGLSEKQVVVVMRENLRPGSYRGLSGDLRCRDNIAVVIGTG